MGFKIFDMVFFEKADNMQRAETPTIIKETFYKIPISLIIQKLGFRGELVSYDLDKKKDLLVVEIDKRLK